MMNLNVADRIKFQADADLKKDIISALRRRAPDIDFQTSDAASLRGLSDDEVLRIAAGENRVLVSHDLRTMPFHFADFIKHQESSGVIIVLQSMSLVTAIEELMMIWTASTPDEWKNQITILPY